MNPPAENQKWPRLPLWQELLVFALASMAGVFVVVAMRSVIGWHVPEWVGIGVGGSLGVIAAQLVAGRKRVKAEEPSRPQS
jgi:hypothetical protein